MVMDSAGRVRSHAPSDDVEPLYTARELSRAFRGSSAPVLSHLHPCAHAHVCALWLAGLEVGHGCCTASCGRRQSRPHPGRALGHVQPGERLGGRRGGGLLCGPLGVW